jgi:hypothetical protein
MRISRHFTVGFLSLSAVLTSQTFAQSAGQCDGKTGFSLQLCQAQATGNATGLTKLDPKASAFTTSYADAIRLDTWSPFEPLDPRPLMTLDRADDGSFILKPGIYDAFVQSYTLDANDSSAPRPGGYFPAPIKGNRAGIIAAVLKDIELHPDVPQGDVQALLLAIASGVDVRQMPVPVQQTAARILPKDVLSQLQGASQAKTAERKILSLLDRRVAKNKGAQQTLGQVDKAETTVQQNVQDFSAPPSFKDAAAGAAPIARGTWAQMPGGFYVRYLPEGFAKTHLQVIVTGSAIAQAGSAPLLFDPTQFIAVSSQAPSERIGISLRPVAVKH